jgi:hypothetical protein
MGSKSDGGAAAAMSKAAGLQRKASRQYDDLEQYFVDPDDMLYNIDAPDLILSTPEERLIDSELADVEVDPRLQAAQEMALSEMEQRGREGLTAEDKAKIDALRGQVGADEKARQASILAGMAQRGALDSGSQLAAQLSSSQAATQRAAEGATQIGAQAAQARREALSQAASTAGNMQQAQYGRDSNVANAIDNIAKFNAGVATRDTGARQQQARDIANVGLTKEQQRVQAAQMPLQQRMQLAGARAGALTGQANMAMQQAGMAQPQASGLSRALSGAGTGASIGAKFGPMGAGIGAGVGALGGLISADGGIKYADGGVGFDPLKYGGMPEEAALQRYNQDQARKGIELAEQRRAEQVAMEQGIVGSGQMSQEEFSQGRGQESKSGGLDLNSITGALGGLGSILGGDQAAPARRTFSPISVQAPEVRQIQNAPVQMFDDGGIAETEALLAMLDNSHGMNHEANGMGTIIDSGEENYTGDELEDRINDREMVLNLDQQDNIEDLLKELAERRRADEMVDNGEAQVNDVQQQTLMDIARGEAEPEDLSPEENIVEPQLEGLLDEFQYGGVKYADGGVLSDPTQDPNASFMDLLSQMGGDISQGYDNTKQELSDMMSVTPEEQERSKLAVAELGLGGQGGDPTQDPNASAQDLLDQMGAGIQTGREKLEDLGSSALEKLKPLDETRKSVSQEQYGSLAEKQMAENFRELDPVAKAQKQERLGQATEATLDTLEDIDKLKAKAISPMTPDDLVQTKGQEIAQKANVQKPTPQKEKSAKKDTSKQSDKPKKTVSLTADELFKQQLDDINDQETGAFIADALSAFANIVNRNQPPGTQIQLPVEAMKNLEAKRDKIRSAKTEAEKQKALIDYRNETLRLQDQSQKLQIQKLVKKNH